MANEIIRFVGQAKHVVEQKPTQHDEYSERDDLLQRYIKRIMSSGTYMIPRDVFILLDQNTLNEIQTRLQSSAMGGDTIVTTVEEDFENDRYILRWWTE